MAKRARTTVSLVTLLGAARATTPSSDMTSTISAKALLRFRRALLRWYGHHHRDLPWRKTRDPYRIWISEIMLQQTRVAAVLDHYRIFLERFPDVAALASAPEDAVLAAWSGLGYYRRARLLHQCAIELVQEFDSSFPQTAKHLQTLPGIGRYTAAAIASIAFDQPIAVVDGNVERVIQRLIGKRLTGRSLTSAQIWQHAQALLAPLHPADFNQAMMELGATVCVPREPKCTLCPVKKWCVTIKLQMERQLPPPAKTPPPPSRQLKKEIWCALTQREGRVRLVQRPKSASLMPGMWELPQASNPPRKLPTSAQWRTFRHSITATNYTVHVLRDVPLPRTSTAAKAKWIAIDRIPQIPITGLTRKILKAGGII